MPKRQTTIFNMAAVHQLTILITEIHICIPNLIEIGWFGSQIWRWSYFHNGGRPPSWICGQEIAILVTWPIPA